MLMLLFYIGDERYAIASTQVVEVIPMVALQKLHQAAEYVAGLFNYRGEIIPVIDLCSLIKGYPCQPYLSTRIILVNYLASDLSGFGDKIPKILGLMAERVTDTLNQPKTEFVEPGIKVNSAPFLGKLIVDNRGMIQCIEVEHLLPESEQADLLPQLESGD